MCAPSIPLPSPPSTRLSRVAPHEACFCTSTPGMPCLANRPLSLATNSAPASVSAMKPRLALVVSGPAACATCAPNGNCWPIAAISAPAPVVLSSVRRVTLVLMLMSVPFFVSVGEAKPGALPRSPIKKPQPETRFPERFLRAAALPVGPSLDQRRRHVPAPLVLLITSGMPTRGRGKNRLESIGKDLIAGFSGKPECRHSLHRGRKPAASLCSAKK